MRLIHLEWWDLYLFLRGTISLAFLLGPHPDIILIPKTHEVTRFKQAWKKSQSNPAQQTTAPKGLNGPPNSRLLNFTTPDLGLSYYLAFLLWFRNDWFWMILTHLIGKISKVTWKWLSVQSKRKTNMQWKDFNAQCLQTSHSLMHTQRQKAAARGRPNKKKETVPKAKGLHWKKPCHSETLWSWRYEQFVGPSKRSWCRAAAPCRALKPNNKISKSILNLTGWREVWFLAFVPVCATEATPHVRN